MQRVEKLLQEITTKVNPPEEKKPVRSTLIDDDMKVLEDALHFVEQNTVSSKTVCRCGKDDPGGLLCNPIQVPENAIFEGERYHGKWVWPGGESTSAIEE